MSAHALWRALILVALGIFLRSLHATQTNFTFEDTLTQIGLGYTFLFLLGFLPPKWQWIALAVILIGYWLALALWPLPGPAFDYRAVGVPPDWPQLFTGFACALEQEQQSRLGVRQWFLNLFPRPRPFIANGGGYLTLSFIPTLGTMILGLIAGRWLRETAPRIPVKRFVAGRRRSASPPAAMLRYTGICPVVKRIWTPSWTFFSGGGCFLLLAAFSWVIEVRRWRPGPSRWWSSA